MNIISLIFFLTTFVACTKMHDVENKNGIDYLADIRSEIVGVKNVEWSVGRKKNKTISRGIRISTEVPRVSEEAKTTLYKKYGVDSWIFKFTKINRGRTSSVGNIYYHFNNISRVTENFSLNIYYHASTVSQRFRNFRCPAFGHRLLINNMDLEYRSKISAKNIYIREMEIEPAKVDRLSFSPHIFSSGRSLKGKFKVKYALYNSKTKQVFSKWTDVAGAISVTEERSISVPSCLGIKEELKPLPESRDFNLKDFEIN